MLLSGLITGSNRVGEYDWPELSYVSTLGPRSGSIMWRREKGKDKMGSQTSAV